MRIFSGAALFAVLCWPVFAQHAQYELKATPETVTWGYYSASAKPVLRIHSGDTVVMHTLLTSSPKALAAAGVPANQIQESLREIFAQVKDRGPGGHILTGPVYVDGAEPGDVLEVRIESIHLAIPYAYNGFAPGLGFLPNEYPYGRMKIIPLDARQMVAHFGPGIEIPLHPFFGSMGDAPPPAAGRISSAPPWMHAGNLDNRLLVAGSTLYIPINAPGALFWAGDGHAGQGDGEVDITAMETSLVGTFQLIDRKDMHLLWPRAETPAAYISMGINADLQKATKMAVRQMIAFLERKKHLSRDDAYMLCSVAGNLHVSEVVDGNDVVSMVVPKRIFVEQKGK